MRVNEFLAVIFVYYGITSWFYPEKMGDTGYLDFLLPSFTMSAETGQIVGAIFLVGAAIVWLIRS